MKKKKSGSNQSGPAKKSAHKPQHEAAAAPSNVSEPRRTVNQENSEAAARPLGNCQ